MLKRIVLALVTVLFTSSLVAAAEVTPGSQAALKGDKTTEAPKSSTKFTGTVELYVTSWCGYCKKVQSYLKTRGIPYVAYDIEKDSAANQRHKELGGQGVPLVVIGSHKVAGYSPEAMDYYLNKSK